MTVSPEKTPSDAPDGSGNEHPAGRAGNETAPAEEATKPDTRGEEARPRLEQAELTLQPGSRMRILIGLEREGRRVEEERSGVGDDIMMLRLAAAATISAVHQLLDGPDRFELVGIKHLHAFDSQVVLVCLRLSDEPTRKLVGCVAAPETLVRGVAMAVLHATNRLVEAIPPPDAEADH